MKELIIEFGNDTLGEVRMYQRNLKGYEQAIKDMKLYKAQQKAEIDYLKAQITAECKEHQEAMQVADKTIRLLEKALEMACESIRGKCDYCEWKDDEKCPPSHKCSKIVTEYFLEQAEEMMKSE